MARIYALIHEEAGAFGISFPDFPGCVSTAETADDAIFRGKQALSLHLDGMIEDGEAIPAPRTLNALFADAEFRRASTAAIVAALDLELPGKLVRVNISIDDALLRMIDAAAKSSGMTRSAFMAAAAKARASA